MTQPDIIDMLVGPFGRVQGGGQTACPPLNRVDLDRCGFQAEHPDIWSKDATRYPALATRIASDRFWSTAFTRFDAALIDAVRSDQPAASRVRPKDRGGYILGNAARKRMRKGCKQRAQTDWLAHTTAANQMPAKRHVSCRTMQASIASTSSFALERSTSRRTSSLSSILCAICSVIRCLFGRHIFFRCHID
jgi:hypothetical protein